MFPFKPRKTRWETARDTVLDAAHDAADNLQNASHNAATIASQAAHEAAFKAGTVAVTATIAGKQLLGSVEDRLQNSGEAAQNLKENLTDSLSRSAHAADERAHSAAQSALQTAQAARETAANKREALVQKKDDLAQTLHDKSEHARDLAAKTSARLSHKRDEIAENTASIAQNVAASAENTRSGWFKRGSEAADAVSAAAQQKSADAQELIAQKSDEVSQTVEKGRKKSRKHAKAAQKDADVAAKSAEQAIVLKSKDNKLVSEDERVEIEEGGSSAMWIAIGLAVGAVVALLLWPKIGGRNRAAVQDKFDEVKENVSETVHKVADKAAAKVDDLSHRADGLAHDIHVAATAPVGTDNPVPATTSDDITLADRVRSELGQTALANLSLNVDSVEGNISVRGAVPDMTTQVELEAIIRAIPGVRDVIFDTPAPDAPPREDSLNHQTEIAERVTESHLSDAVEQPKDQAPADEPFVG